jgi:hypothetical protein
MTKVSLILVIDLDFSSRVADSLRNQSVDHVQLSRINISSKLIEPLFGFLESNTKKIQQLVAIKSQLERKGETGPLNSDNQINKTKSSEMNLYTQASLPITAQKSPTHRSQAVGKPLK